MSIQTFVLSGLTCPACKKITEKRIGGISGVSRVDTNLDSGMVTFMADREITSSEIAEVLKDTDYKIINE